MNIKRTYNPLIFNNVSVTPSASIPSGTMIIKDNNYAILNMEYNITLTKNETYTIDPVIDTYSSSNVNTYGNITTGLSTGACLFNSNGKEVGVITETAQTPQYKNAAGDPIYFDIDTTFSPTSSSYNVNYIKQTLKDNNGGSNNFDECNYHSALQYHEKNNCKNVQTDINAAFYFINVILAVEGVSIPNPFSLFSSSSDVSAGSITNGYEITANAGMVTTAKAGVYWSPITLGYYTYLWGFIPEYHTYDVHEFGDRVDMHFQRNNGGTQSNPYWNYITYTSTFTIVNSYQKPTEFENQQYKAQISETFNLCQYGN